jgi:hypothetical protein
VTNASDMQVDVELEVGDQQWLALAIARPHSRATVEDVLDPGASFRFRFRASGVPGGTVVVSREQLQGAGWRFEIPASVVHRLIQGGATATSPDGP